MKWYKSRVENSIRRSTNDNGNNWETERKIRAADERNFDSSRDISRSTWCACYKNYLYWHFVLESLELVARFEFESANMLSALKAEQTESSWMRLWNNTNKNDEDEKETKTKRIHFLELSFDWMHCSTFACFFSHVGFKWETILFEYDAPHLNIYMPKLTIFTVMAKWALFWCVLFAKMKISAFGVVNVHKLVTVEHYFLRFGARLFHTVTSVPAV